MSENQKEELKSKVYNMLSDLVEDFEASEGTIIKEKDMEDAIDWFMVHFYN